jgi:DNA-binding LacI/PurR family transcriptional regulator
VAIKSKELANLLGVSTATMSLVLNHKQGISDELRSSLLSRIREMGYGYMIKETPEAEPGGGAAAAKNIAYIILSDHQEEGDEGAFFPPVIEGAEREARHLGYHFSIIHMYDEKAGRLRDSIGKDQYAGMIVYADVMSAALKKELDSTEIPYVMLDCYDPDVKASSVTVNNRQGVYAAVRYLLEKGHREIGYVSSGTPRSSLVERKRCFSYACEDLGVEMRPEWNIVTDSLGQKAQDYLEGLWKGGVRPPSALLVENDVLALSVYRALKSAGYTVPEDVSVIGFDGRSICSIMEPTLTTMRIPRRLLGRTLIMLLHGKIDMRSRSMEEVAVRLEMNAELVEMASVRKLPEPLKEKRVD